MSAWSVWSGVTIPSAAIPSAQLKQVFDALRALMMPHEPPPPPKRPIGVITPEDKKYRSESSAKAKTTGKKA